MDPQEDPRMPGPGQGGQRRHQAPAEALASLARIDDEPREFHLCFGVIDPQLAVGHKPPVAVQPEWPHPVSRAGKGRKRTVMAANSSRGPRTIILL
jgi:hypothetical protein